MRWQFSPKRPSDKTRDPVVGEFFASEAIKDTGEALVREAIQNSLDARSPDHVGPVIVRIFVSGSELALPPDRHRFWFESAWPHFLASGNGLQKDGLKPDAPCRFLVLEDFGTTGLVGDQHQYVEAEGAANPFFYFFRAEAKSAKSGKDRGRWGIGKQVFPRSSRTQTFFGFSTVAGADSLMGGCILKHHSVNGRYFKPDGYWGEELPVDNDTLVVPVEDSDTLQRFREDFRLSRQPGSSGLSVVVPWLDEGEEGSSERRPFDKATLLLTALSDYFLPILEGRLEVLVENASGSSRLNASTYLEVLTSLESDGDSERQREIDRLRASLALAERIRDRRYQSFEIGPCEETKASWTDTMLQEEVAARIRDDLAQGRLVRIVAQLTVRPKDAPATADTFECFLSAAAQSSMKPTFVRDDLIISGVDCQRLNGHACVVNIRPGPLATLLGDSEGPAHTEWHPSSEHFKGKYTYGGMTITFVSNFPVELLRRVHATSRQIDRRLLIDLFSDRGPEPGVDPSAERKRPKRGKDGVVVPVERNSSATYRIVGSSAGFTILSTVNPVDAGSRLLVRAAYETSKGNPFKNYEPYDFDFGLDELQLEVDGLSIEERAENRIVVRVDQPTFRLKVTGFDVHRDLVVRSQFAPVPEPVDGVLLED